MQLDWCYCCVAALLALFYPSQVVLIQHFFCTLFLPFLYFFFGRITIILTIAVNVLCT